MGSLVGIRICTLVFSFVACDIAVSQGNSASMDSPTALVDPCKRDVLKYQSNIELVRQSLGDKEAAALQAKFMGKAEWDALLLKDGYCGIARKLREQKLNR